MPKRNYLIPVPVIQCCIANQPQTWSLKRTVYYYQLLSESSLVSAGWSALRGSHTGAGVIRGLTRLAIQDDALTLLAMR